MLSTVSRSLFKPQPQQSSDSRYNMREKHKLLDTFSTSRCPWNRCVWQKSTFYHTARDRTAAVCGTCYRVLQFSIAVKVYIIVPMRRKSNITPPDYQTYSIIPVEYLPVHIILLLTYCKHWVLRMRSQTAAKKNVAFTVYIGWEELLMLASYFVTADTGTLACFWDKKAFYWALI